MEWYIAKDGTEIGPVSGEALHAMAKTGQIYADTLVRQSGTATWVRADQVFDEENPSLTAPVPHEALPADMEDDAPGARPWPRYWARMFDLYFCIALLSFIVGVIAPSLFQPGGKLSGDLGARFVSLLLIPPAMVLDAALYALFGNTPGKAIAGIQVRHLDGSRVSFSSYLRRNAQVYWYGLGIGFPIVSLLTLSVSHSTASNGDTLRWDRSAHTRPFSSSSAQWRLWLIVASLFVMASADAYYELDASAAQQALQTAPYVDKGPTAQLQPFVDEVNKVSPMMVDAETRLDGAESGPELSFIYKYTLINVAVATADLAAMRNMLQGSIRQNLIRAVCSNPALEPLRDTAKTLLYRYSDKDGVLVDTLSLSQADCGSGP